MVCKRQEVGMTDGVKVDGLRAIDASMGEVSAADLDGFLRAMSRPAEWVWFKPGQLTLYDGDLSAVMNEFSERTRRRDATGALGDLPPAAVADIARAVFNLVEEHQMRGEPLVLAHVEARVAEAMRRVMSPSIVVQSVGVPGGADA
jgi:hypothetical protein